MDTHNGLPLPSSPLHFSSHVSIVIVSLGRHLFFSLSLFHSSSQRRGTYDVMGENKRLLEFNNCKEMLTKHHSGAVA